MNPHHQPINVPLNLKSLRTRFALRFLRALRKINHHQQVDTKSCDNGYMVTQRYHKVRVAADASLASAVGPRQAWSRAILLRIRTRPRRRHAALVRREMARRSKQRRSEGQAEQLRRLVPGGEAMDVQSLLDETVHYIRCLSTQVKVMRSIVDICSTTS